MVIVAPTLYGNISKRNLTIGGQGLRGALIETGIGIAETVITNYLTNKFSGKVQTQNNQRKVKSKTFKYPTSKRWKRKRSYKIYNRRNRRRFKKYNRSTYTGSKFSFY